MSGSRCKVLKREFFKRFGRAPSEMETTKMTGFADGRTEHRYKCSEWRRLKKDYVKMRRQPA